jgi:hypothetical protein
MSYLVRPTSKGFRVIQEVRVDGKKKVLTVPPIAYERLGFNKDMTVDEAKVRARQLNLQSDLESKKVANTARRVELMKTEASAYLLASDVSRFELELAEIYSDNPYRHEITLRYWRAAQLAILELAIDPKDFKASSFRFVNYFKKKKWSQDYIKKVSRILNLWGVSVSRHRGTLFEPLPKLDSIQVQKINDAREDAEGVRRAAAPLMWHELNQKKDKFESEGLKPHWNWLFIATWFGLRPNEVDNLKKSSKFWYVKYDTELRVQVLWVYQSKLIRLAKDQRWKPIPVFFPEQKKALELIHNKEFQRPLNKTLHRIFNEDIQVASPRKAFTDFMLELGFDLADISTFLGHQKIDMTWRHYKNRKRFKLPSRERRVKLSKSS